MREMMEKLKLTVNETKTHVCRMADASFNFLGYTFGRMVSPRTGGAYMGTQPSRKSIQKVRDRLNEVAKKTPYYAREEALIFQLNQVLRGWAAYFSHGTLSPAYNAVQRHACSRVRQWLRRKHQVRGRGYTEYPDEHLFNDLGLLNLTTIRRNARTRTLESCPRVPARREKSARPVR